MASTAPLTDVNFDAFHKLRVSQPTTLFDSKLTFDLAPQLWESVLTAGGTVTHLPSESAAQLSVATSGDAVVRQSRYITYRPGKSQLVMVTGTVATSGALSWTEVR